MDPNAREGKKNYWKLDCSQITEKMVRRHFKGLLQLFPELASKLDAEPRAAPPSPPSPRSAACGAVQLRCEVKFSGPFSIESLLKRDSPSARTPGAAPLSSVQVRVERRCQPAHGPAHGPAEERLLLRATAGSSSVWPAGGSSAHRGLAADVIQRVPVRAEPSFSVHTRARAAPYFSSPRSSYIAYFVPALTHDVLRF